jgi:hypothetical protein
MPYCPARLPAVWREQAGKVEGPALQDKLLDEIPPRGGKKQDKQLTRSTYDKSIVSRAISVIM